MRNKTPLLLLIILLSILISSPTFGVEIIEETPEGGLSATFWIKEYSDNYDVPEWLVYAVIDHESGFNKTAVNHNTNGTSDYGYMQVNSQYISGWYEQMDIDKGYFEAFGNHDNIQLGVHILSYSISRGGSIDRSLTVYNAGEGYLNKYGVRDVYVNAVMSEADYWKRMVIQRRKEDES